MDESSSKPDNPNDTDITITPDIQELPVTTPSKTHRYKQCYRLEWESMPDFKGWLKGVPNQPTRAYCTYCDKSLHAHRLSLLKHTCTLKHTKAAQSAFCMKMLSQKEGKTETKAPSTPNHSNSNEKEEDDDEDDPEIPDEPKSDGKSLAAGGDSNTPVKPPASKIPKMDLLVPATPAPISSPSPLSTHVLDTAKGNPVGGLGVTLYKLIEGRWTLIHEGFTNPDGRYTDFIDRPNFVAGRYKLHFDVDRYFELRRQDTLYPFIEIVFDVKSPQEHYHIPLLLSPYGYTTYRGS